MLLYDKRTAAKLRPRIRMACPLPQQRPTSLANTSQMVLPIACEPPVTMQVFPAMRPEPT